MRILVFSDSHGSTYRMRDAIMNHPESDMIIHLGDGERDIEAVSDVIGSRKHVNKLKMLVDHTDTKPLGILRRINGHFLAIDKNTANIRLINTGEHIHQCSLSGTILTQKRENFTLF